MSGKLWQTFEKDPTLNCSPNIILLSYVGVNSDAQYQQGREQMPMI